MNTFRDEKIPSDNVIFAPEGFLDHRYLPILQNEDVRIIEVRVLADGPVFQTFHPNLNNAYSSA